MKKLAVVFMLLLYVALVGFIQPTNILTIDDLVLESNFNELPKLYIEGDINKLSKKKEERDFSVKYESSNLNFDGFAKIKLQGSSSLNYDKKNYTIKLYKDEKFSNKNPIDFGWGEQYKYCLKANWVDKTHARNIVTANIVADIQKKYHVLDNTPNNGEIDGFPIEVYANDEFLGLYTLNIPKDDWMFNMDSSDENHIVFAGVSWSAATDFRKEANFDDWELEVGEETDETLEKFNRLIKFINESRDEEFKEDIHEYLNLDSVLNYYIMVDFALLVDNTGKNMLLSTYDGKIWYVTLYDLDTSWGTNWDGSGLEDYNYVVGNDKSGSNLFKRIKKNFNNELADRYFELREDILTEENIINEFKIFTSSIPLNVYEMESNRWDDIPGYDLKQIYDYLDKRILFLDRYYSDLYNRSPVSIDVDDIEFDLNMLEEFLKSNGLCN